MSTRTKIMVIGMLAGVLAGCGDTARLPEEAGIGPSPILPEPTTTRFKIGGDRQLN